MEDNEVYIEDRFEELIGELVEKVRVLEPGTEQHEKASKALATLYDTRVKYTDIGMTHEDREAQMEIEKTNMERELAIKEAQLKEQKETHIKELLINAGIGLAGIVIPLAAYGVWVNKGFKFEQTGTFTSSTFKNLFRTFKPNKVG